MKAPVLESIYNKIVELPATISLRKKCLNTEFFLVRIFPHSD